MKKLSTVLGSPFILSVIPTLIIILFGHFQFHRYRLEVLSKVILNERKYISYHDLDKDGYSEKILAFDEPNTTGITIFNGDVVWDQWNFRGSFSFGSKKCLYITGDHDGDNIDEVYAFTLSSDSILLHCISDLYNSALSISNRFIARTGDGIKSPDTFIIPAEMDDLDGDGKNELIFGIGTGFSQYPRNVYAYFISADSLIVSPESSYFLLGIKQFDITGDGRKEIIPYGYAAGNVGPEEATIHDHSSFIMALDQDLKFLFTPVEIEKKYSGLTPFIVNSDLGSGLAALFINPSAKNGSIVYKIDNSGNFTDSINLNEQANAVFPYTGKKGEQIFCFPIPGKGTGIFNSRLELSKIVPGNSLAPLIMDLDSDGKNEFLNPDHENGRLLIYRYGLENVVSVDIVWTGTNEDFISVKKDRKNEPEISVQSGRNHYMLSYARNGLYPYYYGLYLALYLGVLGFALTVKFIQQTQLRKKYENEKKINELQLALIRNQLDPHFTFNAISSIIYSSKQGNRELVSSQLQSFANLYRNLILSAGSARTSLKEEIEFCNEYLNLEQIRFDNKFNYSINVPDNVDTSVLIPKMMIQIYAENSLKHGLRPLVSDGRLEINIRNDGDGLEIEITDNGIGRAMAAGKRKVSTGKGLALMNELYSIYNRYYNEKIDAEIIDLNDLNGRPSGTKVLISVKRQKPN